MQVKVASAACVAECVRVSWDRQSWQVSGSLCTSKHSSLSGRGHVTDR